MSFQNCQIVTTGADSRVYHAKNGKRGGSDFIMSSSGLRTFMQCPSRFRAGYEPPSTEAKDFGSLLDCLVLTPHEFSARYAIQPETYLSEDGPRKWNNNASVCKVWNLQQTKDEKDIVRTSEMVEASNAQAALRKDEILTSFIDASDKQVWLEGEWWDDNSGIVVPCKCLIDLVPRLDSEFPKVLGDLKTTRNAGQEAWRRWCYSAGYYIQAAWNLAMYCAATGEDRVNFCFVLVENYSPWTVGRRMLTEDFLTQGRADIEQAMGLYARCLKSGRWPGYDDTDESAGGWSMVAPEPWMASRAMFAPQYVVGMEEAEA